MKPANKSKRASSTVQPERNSKKVRSTVAAARKLRRNMTDVEQTLWNCLRDKQIEEFRFRRQRPMGRYVVDFVCQDAKLIVELDGGQHAGQVEADAKRTAFLESLGFHVLRFWNNDVVENVAGVLERIRERLLQHASSNPTCSARRPLHRATVPQAASTLAETPAPPPALPFAGEGADRAGAVGVTPVSPAKMGRRVRERLSTEFAINRKAAVSPETNEDDSNSPAPSEPPPSPAPRGKAGMGVLPPADATRRRRARKPA